MPAPFEFVANSADLLQVAVRVGDEKPCSGKWPKVFSALQSKPRLAGKSASFSTDMSRAAGADSGLAARNYFCDGGDEGFSSSFQTLHLARSLSQAPK